MTTSEGNKIIAEFMGVKIGVDQYSWRPGCTEPLTEKHLAYHSNWSWLMPVVEKIAEVAKSGDGHRYFDNHEDIRIFRYPLNETWQACVDFIVWHNSQSLKQTT